MVKDAKRYHYLDAVKGLAMYGIVSQHTILGLTDPFNMWLATIKIASFFMVSGILTAIKPSTLSFKEYAFHKFYQIMFPYFVFSFLIIISNFLIKGFSVTNLASDIVNTLILRGIGAIWFLPVFYFGNLLFFKLKKQNNLFIFLISMLFFSISFIFSLIFTFLNNENGIILLVFSRVILVIGKSFLAASYISWGYLFYLTILIKKKNLLTGLFLTTFSIITAQYCKGLDLNFLSFSEHPIIFVITSVIAIMGVTITFKSLETIFSLKFSILSYLSINSLLIMCTHYYFNIISLANLLSSSLSGFLRYLFSVGIVLLFEIIIIEIVNRTKLKRFLFV